MSLYAVLHDADPGPTHRENIMSDTHDDTHLSTRFIGWNTMKTTALARFVASKRATPRFVTIWDGLTCTALVPMERTERADVGSTVNANLSWTWALLAEEGEDASSKP